MGWLSPPDRREITLLLFCIGTYILAYNLETSLRVLGVDSVATSGALFSRIGLGKTRAIDRDGRKPNGWRDHLEHAIYGDWKWDEGHTAGNGGERTQKVGKGRHGAVWASKADVGQAGDVSGEASVDEALQWWRDDFPQTRVLKHAPGYTILDNVFIYNGGVYLVTDDTRDFPPIPDIVSSTGAGFPKWTLFTTGQAKRLFGEFGGVIRGVSWMAADTTPHNSTLLALWRTYTSLAPPHSSPSSEHLTQPHRLLFPHTRFFTDPDPDFSNHTIPRRRADTGFHPYLLKAAFPHITALYLQDFEDYAKMEGVPFVFERIVVADRKAAKKVLNSDGDGGGSDPEFLTAFELGAREEGLVRRDDRGGGKGKGEWWNPIRKNVLEFLDLDEESLKRKKVVTYIVAQDVEGKPKLKEEDHEKLISALKKMERNIGCEVYIVNEDTRRTPWVERMEAIVRSTVVLGVHGDHLVDFAFMRGESRSTLIEMYPVDKFVRDRAVVAESLGQQYVAWSGSQKHDIGNLPQASRPRDHEEVAIDVDAVVKSVQQIISRV
ncbi:hypothetical protein D9756_006594 [Leucocoprinus leucothites]|uniref:Uncharacterized protein n=1 Tax=Leucocoprinus leucothites TaxID=201217 RepID=A0A8H5G2K9_9AGAR|nr:hypothetical protein D9756_006594 [Leucoagaricus leucothites]